MLTIRFNSTTRTEVPKGSGVEIVEFLERGMVLQLPARSCARGHMLVVTVSLKDPKKKAEEDWVFETTAKVEEHRSLEDAVDQVTLALVQYHEKEWFQLQELFSSRQNEIELFLHAARGW